MQHGSRLFTAQIIDSRPKVVIFNPGEAPAEYYTGFLTNRTITGLYAQAIGAAIILIERMITYIMA